MESMIRGTFVQKGLSPSRQYISVSFSLSLPLPLPFCLSLPLPEKWNASHAAPDSVSFCFPFRNVWLPPEPTRAYCFQKISKRQTAPGWNGPPFVFSSFHVSRDHGAQNGAYVLEEISSLNEDGYYFKALTLCSLWYCSHGKNNRKCSYMQRIVVLLIPFTMRVKSLRKPYTSETKIIK